MTARVGLAAMLVAAALAVTATGGFSSVHAERPASILVTEPDDAPLSFDAADPQIDSGRHELELFVLRNQFSESFTLSYEISASDGELPVLVSDTVDGPSELAPGEAASATVRVACGARETQRTFTVTVHADGQTLSLETTVSSTVTCNGPSQQLKQ